MRADAQHLAALSPGVHAERFVHLPLSVFLKAQKCSESQKRRGGIGFIGRIEFQHRAVLIAHAEAGDALAAVGVEHPHRLAELARDAGQKTGKRPRLIVILNHKRAVFEEKLWLHRGRYCIRKPNGRFSNCR